MRFLDFGPEPIQVAGYHGGDGRQRPAEPGGQTKPSTVRVFYNQTRSRSFRIWYSLLCVASPVLFVVLACALIKHLAPPETPIAEACGDAAREADFALNAGLQSSDVSFAFAHALLIGVSFVTLCLSSTTLFNVFAIHNRVRIPGFLGALAATAVCCAFGALIFGFLQSLLGNEVTQLFSTLARAAGLETDGDPCAAPAVAVKGYAQLEGQVPYGVYAVCAAYGALSLAVASIAFRYETNDIDGAWSDTYVLRHKLKGLISLFVLGSLTLVASNIALNAYVDFPADVAKRITVAQPVEKAAGNHSAKPNAAGAGDASTANAGPGATKDNGDVANKRSGEVADEVERLRKSLLHVFGALASLTLVAMFLPAFAGLSGDIEIAGKTHARSDSADAHANAPPAEDIVIVATPDGIFEARAAPQAPENLVAGYKAVEDWKAAHGLALQFSDIAAAMTAAVAPAFSNGIFDIIKSILPNG